jgi:hypothetical protein
MFSKFNSPIRLKGITGHTVNYTNHSEGRSKPVKSRGIINCLYCKTINPKTNKPSGLSRVAEHKGKFPELA